MFYPCSVKWVGIQKFDKGDLLTFSMKIFIVSAVPYKYERIFQKYNMVT